jgi:four helix bundle protein
MPSPCKPHGSPFRLVRSNKKKSRTFEDVELWRKAHAWVLAIYKFTENFPKHELFGLTSQLRRAAVSVPANFAEGFKKRGQADKIRIYNIAQASLEECRYFLILARDLRYGDSSALLAAQRASFD